MKKLIFTLLALIFLSFSAGAYQIKFKIKGAENHQIQVAYYFSDKQYVLQSDSTDSKGVCVFRAEDDLPRGLYSVVLPSVGHFDFLVGNSQDFSIQTDTLDLLNHAKVKGSRENKAFLEYQKKVADLIVERNELQEKLSTLENDTASANAVRQQIDQIHSQLEALWRETVKQNSGTFLAKLLTAMNGAPPYRYNEKDFFEHIDFSESGLLRTPVLHKAMRLILARNLNQNRPTKKLLAETDRLIAKAKANQEVYKYVVGYFLSFFNSFQRIDMNRAFVHIADNYFLDGKADWLSPEQQETLKKRADLYRGSLEGAIAAPLEMQTTTGEFFALHDIQADYTLLLFWKTGCGHCTDALKHLSEFHQKTHQLDFVVYTVYTKASEKDWKGFLEKEGIDFWQNGDQGWINAFDPEKKSKYHQLYYVVSTPALFLLDKDKKIIARRFGDAPIVQLLDELEKQAQ